MADELQEPRDDPSDVIEEDMDLLTDLSPKQQMALQALLREHSVVKVAEAVGVTERTIYNWLNLSAFARVTYDGVADREGCAACGRSYVLMAFVEWEANGDGDAKP